MNWQFEHLSESTPPALIVMNYIVWSWLVAEVSLKLAVHRLFFFSGCNKGWNLLDFMLCIVAVLDVVHLLILKKSSGSDMTFLRFRRVLKVTRLIRVFAVLRFVDELRSMATCLVRSMSALLWCVVLVCSVTSFSAIMLSSNLSSWIIESGRSFDDEQIVLIRERFGSVQCSFLLLIQLGL